MALPHKDRFTYCYLGSTNSVGWWGYDFKVQDEDVGNFINTTGTDWYPYFNPVGEWAWSYFHAFPDYPLTIPDNIVVMQELEFPGSLIDASLYYGGELYIIGNGVNSSFTYPINEVEEMYEPLHPNGEPYTNNEEFPGYGNKLYPRWKDEDPYDWWNRAVPNAVWPYYSLYNPKGVNFVDASIGYGWHFSLKKAEAYNGMSRILNLTTNEYESVPFNPANSSIDVKAKLKLMFRSRLCCFNDGARIEGKIVFKKAYMTITSAGNGTNYGYAGFNISYDTEPVEHSQVDFNFTISSENADSTDVKIQDIDIPVVDGYAVFIDDFYITSVTRP